MTLTNFPDGMTSYGVPIVGGIGSIPLTGTWYFVDQTNGSDGNPGTADEPLATLARAHALCTANNNDVVVFTGTNTQTSTLTWSKNKTHLIGQAAPTAIGKRARITGTGTVFSPLVSVTAEGCYFFNFATLYGFANASAQVLWSEGGDRNYYGNVEFLAFGTDEAAAHTGSRALVISKASGNKGEHTFQNCVFGVDTIARTAANYTLEIANGSPRNYFYNCEFTSYLTGSGANACHLLVGSGGIDRYLKMYNCTFSASTSSGGSVAMTQAFSVNGSAGGFVFGKDCWFLGTTNVETAAGGAVFMANYVPDTADQGIVPVNAP